MNILHINCNYLGVNEVHRAMIRELSASGKNNFDVFVPVKNDTYVKANKGVFAVKCIGFFDNYFYFHKQHKVYRALMRCGIDIDGYSCTHAFTLLTDGGIANRIYKQYKKPYIVAVRDTDINYFLKYKPYLKNRARAILKESSKIVFLSKSYKDILVKKLFRNRPYPYDDKTVIIPNGVDNFWIENIYEKKRSLKNDEVRAIFVGRINKRKNVALAQEAVDLYNDREGKMHLTVVGKIDDNAIFDKIKKSNNVSYLGTKNKDQLLGLYRNHDIFIMPSHTESFGIVYAEAITQGLPVIYTKGQGFDMQFTEGTVGYHVSDTDPNDIVNAVQLIVNNYGKLCNNCVKKCLNFKWHNICKEYNNIYKQIVEVNNK